MHKQIIYKRNLKMGFKNLFRYKNFHSNFVDYIILLFGFQIISFNFILLIYLLIKKQSCLRNFKMFFLKHRLLCFILYYIQMFRPSNNAYIYFGDVYLLIYFGYERQICPYFTLLYLKFWKNSVQNEHPNIAAAITSFWLSCSSHITAPNVKMILYGLHFKQTISFYRYLNINVHVFLQI